MTETATEEALQTSLTAKKNKNKHRPTTIYQSVDDKWQHNQQYSIWNCNFPRGAMSLDLFDLRIKRLFHRRNDRRAINSGRASAFCCQWLSQQQTVAEPLPAARFSKQTDVVTSDSSARRFYGAICLIQTHRNVKTGAKFARKHHKLRSSRRRNWKISFRLLVFFFLNPLSNIKYSDSLDDDHVESS